MTPEQWAERTVTVCRVSDTWWEVRLGERVYCTACTRAEVALEAAPLRKVAAGVIRLAVAEALSAGLPGCPLTAGELAEVAARADAATPGPWHAGVAAEGLHTHPCEALRQGKCENVWAEPGADVTAPCAGLSGVDADFIAAARQDVPALLEHIRHTDALLRDMASDGILDHYRRGHEAGRASSSALLRELEWSANSEPERDEAGTYSWLGHLCPVCREQEPGPHKDGCRLWHALQNAQDGPG